MPTPWPCLPPRSSVCRPPLVPCSVMSAALPSRLCNPRTGSASPKAWAPRANAALTGPSCLSCTRARSMADTGSSFGAVSMLPTKWPTTSCGHFQAPRSPPSCRPLALVGMSRRISKSTKAWDSASTKGAVIWAGPATSPSCCWPLPSCSTSVCKPILLCLPLHPLHHHHLPPPQAHPVPLPPVCSCSGAPRSLLLPKPIALPPAVCPLIPLTCSEAQHLFARLCQPPPPSAALVYHWSQWRRTHQYWARVFHRRRRATALSPPLTGSSRSFPGRILGLVWELSWEFSLNRSEDFSHKWSCDSSQDPPQPPAGRLVRLVSSHRSS